MARRNMIVRPGRLAKEPTHGRMAKVSKTAGAKQMPMTAQENTIRMFLPQLGQDLTLPNRLMARENTLIGSLQCGHFILNA